MNAFTLSTPTQVPIKIYHLTIKLELIFIDVIAFTIFSFLDRLSLKISTNNIVIIEKISGSSAPAYPTSEKFFKIAIIKISNEN